MAAGSAVAGLAPPLCVGAAVSKRTQSGIKFFAALHLVHERLAVLDRRYLRPFSLSVVTYMLPAGFRLASGADSKKPLKDIVLQGLKRWMRGQDLTDGMRACLWRCE